jgi:uracil-DNA glycosylase family 4
MIKIIQPEVVICVGSVATQNVLGSQDTISNLRAKIFNEAKPLNFNGKIFAIYHPSYLLRNPSKKYEMYKDLLFIKEQIPHLL